MFRAFRLEGTFSFLVPKRSLLPRFPREIWERAGESLSMTSQLTVESNDGAENALGLGCSHPVPSKI